MLMKIKKKVKKKIIINYGILLRHKSSLSQAEFPEAVILVPGIIVFEKDYL